MALPRDDAILGTVYVHTETLVISPIALFLSITILALLIAFTTVICWFQNSHLNLLPRDFDSPASILAAVYASETLKGWASDQDRRLTTEDKSSGSKNNCQDSTSSSPPSFT
jgi:hypothetical protein